MKKLIYLFILLGVMVSCTPEYTAVVDDAPVVIRDRENIIQDAIKMNLDSVYIMQSGMDKFYTPLRRMGAEYTTFWSDTLQDGRKIAGSFTYRRIHIEQVYER